MKSYLYPLSLIYYTAGRPYFDSEINKYIKNLNNENNRTPHHEEMLKSLNKAINNVNAQHRKKGLGNYKILIEDKNKYADQLIEEDKRNK